MEDDLFIKETILLLLKIGIKTVSNIEKISNTRTRFTIIYWIDGYQIEQKLIVYDRRYND